MTHGETSFPRKYHDSDAILPICQGLYLFPLVAASSAILHSLSLICKGKQIKDLMTKMAVYVLLLVLNFPMLSLTEQTSRISFQLSAFLLPLESCLASDQ